MSTPAAPDLSDIFAHIDAHRQDSSTACSPMCGGRASARTASASRSRPSTSPGSCGRSGWSRASCRPPAGRWCLAERNDAPGAPTVLLYGHYDVQPPDPLEEWLSPPFEPTIRDGRIYARGVGDNKGQHFAQMLALEALLACRGALPCNVKVLLEGEEEIGSPQHARLRPRAPRRTRRRPRHHQPMARWMRTATRGPALRRARRAQFRAAGARREPRPALRQLGRRRAEPDLDARAPARAR